MYILLSIRGGNLLVPHDSIQKSMNNFFYFVYNFDSINAYMLEICELM